MISICSAGWCSGPKSPATRTHFSEAGTRRNCSIVQVVHERWRASRRVDDRDCARLRTKGAQVAACVHDAALAARLAQSLDCTVDSETLRDPAKIDTCGVEQANP